MKIKRVEGGWWIEESGFECTVTKDGSGWFIHPATILFSVEPPEGVEAKIIARLCRELLACRKESRFLRGDLIAAYSALADLVHLKDISSKSEHYGVVKLAHHPF